MKARHIEHKVSKFIIILSLLCLFCIPFVSGSLTCSNTTTSFASSVGSYGIHGFMFSTSDITTWASWYSMTGDYQDNGDHFNSDGSYSCNILIGTQAYPSGSVSDKGDCTVTISSSQHHVEISDISIDVSGLSGAKYVIIYRKDEGDLWSGGHAHTGYSYSGNYPLLYSDKNSGSYYCGGTPYVYTRLCFGAPVSININATPASGVIPLEVAFQDDSTGVGSGTYALTFGDGQYASGDWSAGQYWWHTYYNEGTYNVSYNVTTGGTSYYDSVTITTTNLSAGGVNYYVQVSGLDTQVIEGATVDISYPGGSDSEETNDAGRAYFGVSPGRLVTGTVNKDGYQEAAFSQYIPAWNTWTPVTLYTDNETPGTGDAYANLILTISNKQTGEPITSTPVFVKIYSDGSYSDLYEAGTTYTGTYNALLPVNITYYFKLEAAVYANAYFSQSVSETTYLTKYMNPINPGSDIDDDGIPDMWDDDIDGDGIDNDLDTDDDGDGTPDASDDTPGGGTQQVLQPVIHIWAYSTIGNPISGALVTVTSDTDSGSTVTTPNGTAYYFCQDLIQGESRVYNVTVHHGAYTDQSAYITVSTQNPSITYYMVPASGVVVPTTPEGYYPPVLPTWSGTNGTPGNMQEFIFNYTIGTLGISFTASGMLLGLIICIVCACLVGGFSNSGMGAMIGGGFGWLAAGVMGYIPAWAIIVSVAIVVMAFFVMRGSGSED